MTNQHLPLGFRAARGRFVPGNSVRLLRDGREAFPVMLEDIARAERQILLEMYWFDSDQLGRRFAEALKRAARRGVEVAIIYDAIGSISADRAVFAELESAGAKVLEYNPVAPWRSRFRLAGLSRRDHRKLLVVDGSVGFTGGINLANHWAPSEEGGGGWRDDMMRIVGPAVDGLTLCFQRVWRRKRMPRIQHLQGSVPAPAPGQRLVPVRVLGQRYYRHQHEIARDYASRLYAAKKTAYIANPYFVPDGAIRRALMRAAKRGVDVRVIVPGRSDVEAVKFAGRAQHERLLDAGVRIYEWQGGMFHAKTAVVDREWCTTGTFNFDHMSLRNNLEVNASVLDAEIAAQVEQSFHQDLKGTREVLMEELRARPIWDRLLDDGFYRLRKFL